MVSQRAIQAGRAEILLRIRDQTQQGLENARRRLVSFAQSVSIAGVAITGFGAALTAPFARAGREFARVEQLLGRFDAVLGSLTVRGNIFAAGLASNLKISANTVKDLVATFQALNQGSGLSGKQALDISTQLAKASLDLKAFDDRIQSTEEAARILASGLSGETEPVRRAFGGDVTARALDLELLRLGINRTSAQATEAERKMARFNLIIRQLAAAGVTGQAAREVNTLAARIEQLGDVSRDTFASIGAAFGPTLATLAGSLVEGLKDLGEFARENKALTASLALLATTVPALGIALTALGISAFGVSLGVQAISAAVGVVLTPIGVFVKLVSSAVFAVTNLAKALLAVTFSGVVAAFGAIRIALIGVVFGLANIVKYTFLAVKTIPAVVKAVGALVKIFLVLTKITGLTFELFFASANVAMIIIQDLAKATSQLASALATIGINLAQVSASFSAALISTIAALVPAVITVAVLGIQIAAAIVLFRFLGAIITAVAEGAVNAASAIGKFLSAIGQTASTAFQSMGSVAATVFGNISAVASAAFDSLSNDARVAFSIIENSLRTGNVEQGIKAAFNFMKIQALEVKAFMLEQWGEVGPKIVATFNVVFDNLKERFKAITEFLSVELDNAIAKVQNAVETTKKEAKGAAVGFVGGTVAGLTGNAAGAAAAGSAAAEAVVTDPTLKPIKENKLRDVAAPTAADVAREESLIENNPLFKTQEEADKARAEADRLRREQSGVGIGAEFGNISTSLSKLARGTGFDLIGRFADNRFQKAFEARSFAVKQDGGTDEEARQKGIGFAVAEELFGNKQSLAEGIAAIATTAAENLLPSTLEGSVGAIKDIEKSFGAVGGSNLSQTFAGPATKPLKEAVEQQKETNSILSDTLDFFQKNFSFKFD